MLCAPGHLSNVTLHLSVNQPLVALYWPLDLVTAQPRTHLPAAVDANQTKPVSLLTCCRGFVRRCEEEYKGCCLWFICYKEM